MADVLFLHIPRPSGLCPNIFLVPNGIFPLVALLNREGIETTIVHPKVEEFVDGHFDLESTVFREAPRLVALTMHWYHQSALVLETARRLKESFPELKVVVGGITASFFRQEVLRYEPAIDYLVYGDSEEGLLGLARYLIQGRGQIEEVPNLVYRKGKEILDTGLRYVATPEILASLDHTEFAFMRNLDTYLKLGLNEEGIKDDAVGMMTFVPGRGCSVNCSFCGGSQKNQKRIMGRGRPLLLPVERVLEELERAYRKYDVRFWIVPFDPYPKSDYYLRLFKGMHERDIGIQVSYESYLVPSRELVQAIAEYLPSGSKLTLSPESGSEKVRRLNKSFFFTNAQLLESLKLAYEHGIGTEVYFMTGFPFEGRKEVEESARLIEYIRTNFPDTIISVFPLDLEPGGMMYYYPEVFRIKRLRVTFEEFVEASRGQCTPGLHNGHFSPEEIMENALWLSSLAGFDPPYGR